MPKILDLAGQKFGRLIAVEPTSSCKCLVKEKARSNSKDKTNLSAIRSNTTRSNSTTGVTGVTFHGARKYYVASITCQGKRHFLGNYGGLKDATKARKEAEAIYFNPILEKYGMTKN